MSNPQKAAVNTSTSLRTISVVCLLCGLAAAMILAAATQDQIGLVSAGLIVVGTIVAATTLRAMSEAIACLLRIEKNLDPGLAESPVPRRRQLP